jgi:hypothetical protein
VLSDVTKSLARDSSDSLARAPSEHISLRSTRFSDHKSHTIITMSTSSEPPSPELPSYNREEIIATLTDFYEFLSKLPWLESRDILYPPEGGWPNITKENFAFLGKNEEVIALLRHLPYIRMDGKDQYVLAYSTFPCDYRRDYFQSPAFEKDNTPWEMPETGGRFEFPSWVVPLTYGKSHGDYLMLDTTDGGFHAEGEVSLFKVHGVSQEL